MGIITAVNGTTTEAFLPVKAVFESLWDHIEVGAGLTIYSRGEKVVDLWAGYSDLARTKPFEKKTLTNTYSATKGIMAIGIACLVDDGMLAYDKPVCHYWPEFGAESKFKITVTQLLSHQAGLYQFIPPVQASTLYDWQTCVRQLAAQRPQWEPGTQFGYHTLTWGYLVGELIRRITRMTPGEFLRSRVTGPSDADFIVGITTDHDRCSEMIGPNRARSKISPPLTSRPRVRSADQAETSPNNLLSTNDPTLRPYQDVSSTDFRTAQIPSTNGHSTSEGLARCYQSFLEGSLVSAQTLAMATEEITPSNAVITDLVLGQKLRRSRGFILNSPDVNFGPTRAAFGHPGTAGCVAFADPENEVAFAYLPNQLHNQPDRSKLLIDALYQCLGQ